MRKGAGIALSAIAIQGLGAAATLVASALVARAFGVEAQGRYALLKGWNDLIATLALFGLPQAMLHLAYRGRDHAEPLRRFALGYSLLCLAVGLAAAAGLGLGPWAWLAAALVAAPLLVAHGLWRSLLLHERGPLVYAVVTATPAMALLISIATLAALARPQFGGALIASGLVSAVVAGALLGRLWPPAGARLPLAGLRQANLHTFVQNVAAAAQPALILSLLPLVGADAAGVGELSLALLFLQVFGALAGFAAPAVYDRVARGHGLLPAGLALSQALGLLAAASAVLAIAAPSLLPLLLPAGRAASPALAEAARWAALGGGLTLATRTAATLLQASARFEILSVQAAARLLLALALCAGLARVLPPAEAGALGWTLAEAAVALHCAWLLRPR